MKMKQARCGSLDCEMILDYPVDRSHVPEDYLRCSGWVALGNHVYCPRCVLRALAAKADEQDERLDKTELRLDGFEDRVSALEYRTSGRGTL